MMYHRRKILLAILEAFGGRLSAIQLQKYLFLTTRRQSAGRAFDFVPYHYGCFSFQANQDMRTLQTYGYVSADDHSYELTDASSSFLDDIGMFDRQAICDVVAEFGSLSQDELVRYTYIHYPYYAINSKMARRLLSDEELQAITLQRPAKTYRRLYTIGYEGVTLESYLNRLIVEDVKVLCDVRKNAYSQKFGFSKSQLSKACDGVGIRYVHLPALGIDSDRRQSLTTQADYDRLFDDYEATILPKAGEALEALRAMLHSDHRVALTCFERNPRQCHRTRVARRLMAMADGQYTFTPLLFD